ncbi:unnamed protein product [Orchesella dallaii]|uniref:Uncharacterized protein n=1 Tax=Orchesella dallaii TaxID=48710 RepID=A0ABP1PM17_9HEXA
MKAVLLFPLATGFICFASVFGAVCGNKGSNGEKTSTTPMTFPVDCKPYHLRSMKVLLKTFNRCTRELKANVTSDKEFEENMGCAMKCTMRSLGYSVNDYVTLESIKHAVSALLPDALAKIVTEALLRTCHVKYGDKLNPDEPQCRSYSEYAFCIQNAIADMVDSELCIQDKKKQQAGKEGGSR